MSDLMKRIQSFVCLQNEKKKRKKKKRKAAMDFINPISIFCLALTADCESSLLYINGTK